MDITVSERITKTRDKVVVQSVGVVVFLYKTIQLRKIMYTNLEYRARRMSQNVRKYS
jgi:hypothetical protein